MFLKRIRSYLSFFSFSLARLLYCFSQTLRSKIALRRMNNFLDIQDAESKKKTIHSHTKVSIQEEMESFQSRERMRAHA